MVKYSGILTPIYDAIWTNCILVISKKDLLGIANVHIRRNRCCSAEMYVTLPNAMVHREGQIHYYYVVNRDIINIMIFSMPIFCYKIIIQYTSVKGLFMEFIKCRSEYVHSTMYQYSESCDTCYFTCYFTWCNVQFYVTCQFTGLLN